MFWGAVLTQGKNYKLGETEDLASPLLHISNAAIGKGGEQALTVFAKVSGKEFILTYL